jgi:LPXTG-site transpeptidase (sortase) family protein
LSESATSTASTVPAKAGAVLRRSLHTFKSLGGSGGGERRSPGRVIETAAPADLRRAIGRPSDRTLLRASGWAMVVFATLVVGLALHLFVLSNLAEHRSQSVLFNKFRGELTFGTAPIGQVDANGALLKLGAPVAILSIPSLGVKDTVVEGTTGRALLAGPGHRRDTPLPGQQGVSVLYGRQASYGGPFAKISHLKAGDEIVTTTGQGKAAYRVTDVRYAGDKAPALASPTAGALTLVTAHGTPLIAGAVIRVDAKLVGTAFPTPQPVLRPGTLQPSEDALASDPSGWLMLFLWGEAALVVAVGVVIALRRWGRWHTWIVGVPLAILVGVEIAKQIVVVLPNLY